MQTDDIEAMEIQLAEIVSWRKSNMDKLGTLKFSKSTLAHRILTEIVRARGGGGSGFMACAAESLKQVEDGTHPALKEITHRSK